MRGLVTMRQEPGDGDIGEHERPVGVDLRLEPRAQALVVVLIRPVGKDQHVGVGQKQVPSITSRTAARHAVIMRKVQLGTQSEQGNRWVERILSIRETLRLQDCPVLDYLIDAATAAHHGQPAPSPLPP